MFISEILENVVGGDGPLDEARDAVIGGCFGLILSGGFLFAFFFLLITLLSGGISDVNFQVSARALPIVLCIGASSFLSPLAGVLMGIRGRYSCAGQVGCFAVWLGILIAAAVALSLL